MRVLLEQGAGAVEVLRQANDLEMRFLAEGFAEAALDEVDRERSDVDPDPK